MNKVHVRSGPPPLAQQSGPLEIEDAFTLTVQAGLIGVDTGSDIPNFLAVDCFETRFNSIHPLPPRSPVDFECPSLYIDSTIEMRCLRFSC